MQGFIRKQKQHLQWKARSRLVDSTPQHLLMHTQHPSVSWHVFRCLGTYGCIFYLGFLCDFLLDFFDFLWLELDPAIHLLWHRVFGACSWEAAVPADLDGDPQGFFSSASCLSPFSALSFLLFLDLWSDLSLLHAPDALPLECFFLHSFLGPLQSGNVFFICCPKNVTNCRHFPQEKLLQ